MPNPRRSPNPTRSKLERRTRPDAVDTRRRVEPEVERCTPAVADIPSTELPQIVEATPVPDGAAFDVLVDRVPDREWTPAPPDPTGRSTAGRRSRLRDARRAHSWSGRSNSPRRKSRSGLKLLLTLVDSRRPRRCGHRVRPAVPLPRRLGRCDAAVCRSRRDIAWCRVHRAHCGDRRAHRGLHGTTRCGTGRRLVSRRSRASSARSAERADHRGERHRTARRLAGRRLLDRRRPGVHRPRCHRRAGRSRDHPGDDRSVARPGVPLVGRTAEPHARRSGPDARRSAASGIGRAGAVTVRRRPRAVVARHRWRSCRRSSATAHLPRRRTPSSRTRPPAP